MNRTAWHAALAVLLVLATLVPSMTRAALPHIPSGEEREMLWRAKQEALERLQAELLLPPDATRASQDEYDVLFYDVDIAIDPASETVEGTVAMKAISLVEDLSGVILNLFDNMTVDSVTFDSSAAPYTHTNDLLTIGLPQMPGLGDEFEVTVTYHGSPVANALDFSYHLGEPIVSSLSEPNGAREWWPCKDRPDDKADSVRIAITVPDDLVAVSEGVPVSETYNGDGTATFEWFEGYPITTYLVSVAVTNYSLFIDYYHPARGDSMPITHYVYPEDLSDAEIDLDITPAAIGFFASVYGEYPFLEEKYGHAEFPWGGAMEHQTCTSYGAVLIRGDHHYDWILVHELSHQWWGDWVTCATWEDIWLNEGFASYSEALWFENLGGVSSYRDYVDSYDYYGYFDGPIYDPDQTFGRTVYDKGALVMHMLRRVLELDGGPQSHYPLDGLEEVLSTYSSAKAYESATTPEFQSAAEAVYGASLDWFFQEWVYGENRPEYEYGWTASDAGDHWDIMVHVEQVQTDAGLFTMPIDLMIETAGADELVTVWSDQWSQDFFLEVGAAPTGVEFDPYNWVLKNVAETGTGVAESDGAPGIELSRSPAIGSTALSLTMPASGPATIGVYDVTGRLVAVPFDGTLSAGVHSVRWDGRGKDGTPAASGVYFVRFDTPSGSDSERVVFLR